VRISVAIFSYDGGLYVGVTGDSDSSSDVDTLTAGVEHAISELLGVIDPVATNGIRAKAEKADVEGEQPRVE
jgi:hypothetical protein